MQNEIYILTLREYMRATRRDAHDSDIAADR